MTPMDRHPDRRSPLVFDTTELSRRAGTMREVGRTVPAPADLGLEVIAVPEGSDVELDLRLEAVVEGVLVTGTATVQLQGECARCLTGIEDEMSFDLQELFFHPGREVDEDERLVDDESIDLEPTLRDAVVMDLPFTPLCREDCLGLCPECGADLNDDPDHEHDLAVDPRWSKLVGLDVEE
ncbi:YceD family protein [Tessaracoccus antarcticus]|uniref:DUF177 domain-containing protein n=1 Tax=Tessaracoccus antarcticus TaxID=2479848 RepID=A0A3M0GR95_9ACTN|nr:YceD family protein [Tessaracoccus antarcticus]RMB59796.1 DUF177 domain-containing protein [Tessaracoccus antarcticus]